MWIYVYDCKTHGAIGDARFNFDWENYGGGQYWVDIGNNEILCAGAPGYSNYCFNVGAGPGWNVWICAAPPPPPPTSCDAWS